MNCSPRIVLSLAWALCLAASLLTGCSTQEIKQQQVENNLVYGALPKAQIGDTKQARLWADRAIAVDPTDPDIYAQDPSKSAGTTVALVFAAVGDDPTLIDYMKQGQKKFPDNRWILATLAAAQARTGDITGQKATSANLVKLLESKVSTPGHVPDQNIMTMLGQAYWDSGDAAKGTETLKRQITLHPRETEPLNTLAYCRAVYNIKPALPEAMDEAKRALRLAKQQHASEDYISAVQDTLGWVQYRMGDYQSALNNLQQAAGVNPRQSESRYHLGMVYKALGNTEAARVEMSHATLLSKGYADAARELEMLSKAPASPKASPVTPPGKTAL